MIDLDGMTQDKWNRLTPRERAAMRDESGLTPQLRGLEGCRVEVCDSEGGAPRRFKVGRSTGWRPCHLELHNVRSLGGDPARRAYASVRVVRHYPGWTRPLGALDISR